MARAKTCRPVLLLLAVIWTGCSTSSAGASEVKPRKTQAQRQEESLFRSLMNCPLCKGKEAVACFKRLRYDEGKTWRQCLEECIDNHLIRSTFLMMLPEDDAAKETATDAAALEKVSSQLSGNRVAGAHSEL
eukprot:TRINITY_DN9836_c0_g1_i1.p1 TRINITY_DN9836_c0_g1~~TRINITY_DN9836_c0_g1_i1.p1  ORF type:complete len:132 (-),score=27.07 TRINITY_DN9836_c0_g1_i1:215-610(-)